MLVPGKSWGTLFWMWVCVFLLMSIPGSRARCPHGCLCANRMVQCVRKNIAHIPSRIPHGYVELNLQGNLFKSTAISRANFSEFHSLERIHMGQCGIEILEMDTFADLVNLHWLDLSNNRIRVLEDFTFRGLNLEHLFLVGNKNLRIKRNAFAQMRTKGLYLSDCLLRRVSLEVLSPLATNRTLQKLWLDGNDLKFMEKNLKSTLQTLIHLRLGNNPFHCNCELTWLKEFYDRHAAVFEGAENPKCATPHRLMDMSFDDVNPTDFQCFPPVFLNVDAHFDHEKVTLKCTASGDPPPTLFWITPRGVTRKYQPVHTEGRRRNSAEWFIPANPQEDLSGQYICLAINAAGNVTLTRNMTLPHKNKPPHHPMTSPDQVPPFQGHGDVVSDNPPPHGASTIQILVPPRTSIPTPREYNPDEKYPQPSSPKNDNSTLKVIPFNLETNKEEKKCDEGSSDRLFTLVELVGAIAGTCACTVIICVVILPIYYRSKNRHRHPHHSLREKPPPPPPRGDMLYMPPMPDMEYMDSPNHVPKDNKPDLMVYLDGSHHYGTIGPPR